MMIVSVVLAFVAWAMLYLAMDQPYRELFIDWTIQPKQALLKFSGGILLILSLWCSTVQWGSTVGFAAWWIILSVSAFSFTILRTFWPSRILLFTGAIVLLGSLGSLLSLLLTEQFGRNSMLLIIKNIMRKTAKSLKITR